MITSKDLDAISGYVRNGFGSLGIVSGKPAIVDDGSVEVNCYGIDPGDVDVAADRIAQAMGRKGWDVDVWVDEWTGNLKIDDKEHEVQ